jgi:hypothetical protein
MAVKMISDQNQFFLLIGRCVLHIMKEENNGRILLVVVVVVNHKRHVSVLGLDIPIGRQVGVQIIV